MSTGSLDEQSAAFDELTNLYKIQFELDRMLKNLALINNSPNAEKIILANANLYELAAKYYGDWTLWQVIQKANNLTDFIVPGIHTIIIPPKPT